VNVRIDFHTHVCPVGLPDFASATGDPRWPLLRIEEGMGRLWVNGAEVRALPEQAWSVARRIESMDSSGTDLHVLSPIPPLLADWAEPARAAEFCTRVNDGIAAMVAEAPARLAGFAMVPLQDEKRAIVELERVCAGGFRGVEIGTTAGDRELDDPGLRGFFTCASELGMTIFIHPLILGASTAWTSRIDGFPLGFGLGMTTDTAIAAGRLVLGGLTSDLPDLKLCLAHGGGTFAWALPRLEVACDVAAVPPLADRIRNVYVDTVVYDRANLDYLVARLGSERVVWGTDYPLPAADTHLVDSMAPLSVDVADRIFGGNAARLLQL
jgi:aminocarboxymuconate-semialdehyde decarboxylase